MIDRSPPRSSDAAAGELSRDRIGEMLRGWVENVLVGPPPAVPRPGDHPLRRGVSVSIEGNPGMGKSHLGWSMAERARALGVRVVSARGRERLSRNSFGVVQELVGGPGTARDPGDAVFERVDAWAAQGPVLCWVDDLHWVDSASLTVLRRLAWAGRDLPLVLVLAGRSAPTREPVTLVTRSVDHRVVLPPMTDMAVEALTKEKLGGWPGPRLRRHLQQCRGNPLFVTDVLAGLRSSGRLASAGRDRVDLIGPPPSAGAGLQAQLDDHLRQVGETARELLAALAAWGTPATESELANLLYVTPDAVGAAVEAALASGVVQWSGDGADRRLQFVHDLYAERALVLLEPAVLRSMHRRAAVLRGTAGEGPAVVAEHLLLADDPAAVADEELVAALRAAAVEAGEWAPAVRAELLGDLRAIGPAAAGDEVAVGQVEALYTSGQQGRAVEVAARHLTVTTDRATAASLQTVVLRALVNRADTAAALRAIEQTLAVAGLPAAVRRQLGQLRCWVWVLAGERTRARAELGPLLDEAVAHADADVQYGLLTSLAILEYLDARPRSALDLVDRQNRLTLSEPALVESRMSSLIWPPLFQLYADGVDTALRGSLAARRTGAALGAYWLEPFHSFVAAGIASTAGHWDDAAVEGDTGLERAEEIGTGWISLAVGERAALDVRRGHLEEARRRLDELAAAGFAWQFGSPDPALAQLLILEAGGAGGRAGAAARELWSTAALAGPLWMLRAAPDVARVALTGWDPDLARRVADDVAELSVSQSPILAPVVDLVGGMADGSLDRIRAAAAAADAAGNAPLAAAAHEEVAVAAGTVGRADIAREALDVAVTAYRTMGASTDVDRTAARLRALGIRRGSRVAHRVQTGGPASLTATERRVTALVRDGLTNPEIAARLFVSPRTVQTHVSHILAKLGVRSRVEVARMELPEEV